MVIVVVAVVLLVVVYMNIHIIISNIETINCHYYLRMCTISFTAATTPTPISTTAAMYIYKITNRDQRCSFVPQHTYKISF